MNYKLSIVGGIIPTFFEIKAIDEWRKDSAVKDYLPLFEYLHSSGSPSLNVKLNDLVTLTITKVNN